MFQTEAINCIQSLIYRENDAKLSRIDDKKHGTLENIIEVHYRKIMKKREELVLMELNEILEYTETSYNPYMLKIFLKYSVFQG